ncbi:MAG: 6-carboxytetrahydropterin synthase [Clostridiales bacterium]|nr:6-carboxytetrahydropterin synthase [Clostridiales bacterium]
MYTIKTQSCFDSAHFLWGYEGKCSNIHGHRWTVEIEVEGRSLGEAGQRRGMLMDFSSLKDDVKREADVFDHTFIIERGSLKENTLKALEEEGFKITEVDFRPTAECFAEYFFRRFKDLGYEVKQAVVYETPNNCASYGEG